MPSLVEISKAGPLGLQLTTQDALRRGRQRPASADTASDDVVQRLPKAAPRQGELVAVSRTKGGSRSATRSSSGPTVRGTTPRAHGGGSPRVLEGRVVPAGELPSGVRPTPPRPHSNRPYGKPLRALPSGPAPEQPPARFLTMEDVARNRANAAGPGRKAAGGGYIPEDWVKAPATKKVRRIPKGKIAAGLGGTAALGGAALGARALLRRKPVARVVAPTKRRLSPTKLALLGGGTAAGTGLALSANSRRRAA